MATPEQRSFTERRRRPRGGRRDTDAAGQAPLVLVVGGAPHARDASEAVLAKLRFAVATSGTAAEALQLMPALRPDIVVVAPDSAGDIRTAAPKGVRVLEMPEDPASLVDAIRRSLAA